ncbi:MAG: tRNA pseudouridine(38-40) synthase TruA [Planctomycetaceae bacterium]|nr:tRNA pseudouridine(38-40) synthase TruA [Planctomycetaceae bacterium]
MRNIRLTVSYDGTRYLGWQWQPYGPTIQGELQDAVLKLTGETADVIGSGRTDAGVHAVGQVANFTTSSVLPLERFQHGLTYYLPRDIVIRDVAEAPLAFHSQFGAKRKRYRYVLSDAPPAVPFLRPYAWFMRGALDAEAMHQAGQVLVGRHDFRCFETKWPNKATSVRTVMELTIQRAAGWEMWSSAAAGVAPAPTLQGNAVTSGKRRQVSGDPARPFVCLEIVADGFLWNMVRAITGTLVKVGIGKWTADDVRRILVEGDRKKAGETAPAQGLFLVSVDYDGADRLPES